MVELDGSILCNGSFNHATMGCSGVPLLAWCAATATTQATRRSTSNLIDISEKKAMRASGYQRTGSWMKPKRDVAASGGEANDLDVIATTNIGHKPVHGIMYQSGSNCAISKAVRR